MNSTAPSSQAVIDEFVGAAHGDVGRVQALLARDPGLAQARASWGETALQAAAQMGREDLVTLLLDAGAPLDFCTAAMLGQTAEVTARLQADPTLAQATGAH